MMEEQDAVLATQARAGDDEAFRRLVERHSHALFRLVYRMTGNEQDAEDLVQETFLRAHRQLGRFEARAGFSTWLHRIAANAAIDLLRGRRRQTRTIEPCGDDSNELLASLPSSSPAPDHAAGHAEVRRQVESALDELTPIERAAFVFRHFEHKSIEEIGATLRLGNSAAKQAVFRAVQKMRRALEPLSNSSK